MAQERFNLITWRKNQYRRTQAEMAEELGIGFGQYRNYEYRSDQPIPSDVLAELTAKGYKPLGADIAAGQMREVKPQRVAYVKSAGKVGAAVLGMEADSLEALLVPAEFAHPDFSGAIVEGDSMMPLIHEGDTCVFMDSSKPRNRYPVAVYLDGDDIAVVKEMVFEGGRWLLRSWNSAYPDRELSDATMRGYLVGIISRAGDLKIGPEYDGLTRSMIEDKLRARLF